MPLSTRSLRPLAWLALAWCLPCVAPAQDPAKPPEPNTVPVDRKPYDQPIKGDSNRPPDLEFKDEIKPLPPVAIPDDPPPHEGAFFDLPVMIEPPDIIVVEVLESLPGRPITGERLVRPDGTISLGFYGDVHVRGLTLEQAKVRVILRLRKHINDEVMGLLQFEADPVAEDAMPPEGGKPMAPRNPFDLDRKEKADPVPEEVSPREKKPESEAKPSEKKEGRPTALESRKGRSARGISRPLRLSKQTSPRVVRRDQDQDVQGRMPKQKPDEEMVIVEVEEAPSPGHWKLIPRPNL